jgi:tetratricopeptide (TPR) repeat protein
MQLGATRKFNIATFLKAFASQPAPNPHFAYLKEIHLLTALSILSPQQLEKQIIQNINHAENDEAKIKQLLLHHALMNPKMPSALSKISGAVAESNDFDEIVPVLIETDDENDIGVFKLELPEFLQGKLRIVKRISEKQMKELARSYLYEGERYQMQKDLDNAFLNFRKFLDITKPLCDNHPTGENMLLLAVGYLRLGEAYQSIEDWQAAITNFNFFLEIAKYLYNIKSTNENAKNLAISYLQLGYSRLGTTYQSLKDWNKALQFFQEFLMLTQQVHANKPSDESLKNLAFGYSKLGEIYQSQKDWDKALQFFQESLRITKLLDKQNDENLKNLAMSYSKLGEIYHSQKDWDKALQYFQHFLKIAEQLHLNNPSDESLKYQFGRITRIKNILLYLIEPNGSILTGKIQFYSGEKGWGSIATARKNRDTINIYFHNTNWEGEYLPQQDEMVSFEVEDGPKGINAVNVTPCNNDGSIMIQSKFVKARRYMAEGRIDSCINEIEHLLNSKFKDRKTDYEDILTIQRNTLSILKEHTLKNTIDIEIIMRKRNEINHILLTIMQELESSK